MPGVAKVQERSGIRQLTLPAQPRDPMRGDIVEEVLRAMLFRSTSARQRIRHGIRHMLITAKTTTRKSLLNEKRTP